MPRSNGRASQVQVDRIHRLMGKLIERELKDAVKAKASVPAALLGRAAEFLKLCGTDAPAKPVKSWKEQQKGVPTFADGDSQEVIPGGEGDPWATPAAG